MQTAVSECFKCIDAVDIRGRGVSFAGIEQIRAQELRHDIDGAVYAASIHDGGKQIVGLPYLLRRQRQKTALPRKQIQIDGVEHKHVEVFRHFAAVTVSVDDVQCHIRMFFHPACSDRFFKRLIIRDHPVERQSERHRLRRRFRPRRPDAERQQLSRHRCQEKKVANCPSFHMSFLQKTDLSTWKVYHIHKWKGIAWKEMN